MTNEEAARERDRIRQEMSERSSAERNRSTQERIQEIKNKNIERSQQRESATNVINSGNADIKLSEIAKLGGPVGRKLEREIRQFQQTGRVSNWLAGEALKAEAAQNAAQQAAFRQQVSDVISSPLSPIQLGPIASYTPPLNRKPEIPSESGGTAARRQSWDIYVVDSEENSWTLKVFPSTLSNILPDNYDDEFVVSGNDIKYGKAIVSTDGQFITSVSIGIDNSPPSQQTPQKFGIEDTVEILFGLFKDGKSFNTTGGKPISLKATNVLSTPSESPSQAGDPLYDLYFLLQ